MDPASILLPPADSSGPDLSLGLECSQAMVKVKVQKPHLVKSKHQPQNRNQDALPPQLPPAIGSEDDFLTLAFPQRQPRDRKGQKGGKPGKPAPKKKAGTDPCHPPDIQRCTPFSGCLCKKVHQYEGDAVAEVFCPPRLAAEAQARGLKASISLDKDTGWDANVASEKQRAQALLRTHKPWLLLVSPECRMYSIMQRNCNQKKMDPKDWDRQMEEADDHLDFSMNLIIEQGKAKRKFIFEHPSGAASWKKDTVQRVLEEVPDATIVSFAQCRFGLKAPNDQPLQKLTKFLTNSPAVIQMFQGCQCVCSTLGLTHAKIEGSMDGHCMSRWAQKYPALLVSALMDCCQREMP